MALRALLTCVLISLTCLSTSVFAASGSPTTNSPMAGNGHNVSFDGRIFIVRQSAGWMLMVFRPEALTYAPGGIPILTDGAFSGTTLIQLPTSEENALAICEPDADATPYACNDAGAPTAAGPYACYDFVIFDSDAAGAYNGLRRRELKVWVANPDTNTARLHRHQWTAGMTPMARVGGGDMRGIEPTVTRDGRLLVWQGHPDNDGKIDILMYATNDTPCAAGGWDGPHVISHMFADARVRGRYRLAERQLRGADGTPYADRALFRGAYPWLFPEGDAITFTAVNMPCRGTENPPGCGPRRNGLSVIGYPTNWGLSHIDGDVNPSTTDTVRLFFSSPGPGFGQLPVTGGTDVWPFFGSNTSNYTELVFDDGLDGQYAGVWHLNESVDVSGNLDRTRTPDTSGYFNTANVMGAVFPDANNGLFGKAMIFGGDGDHVVVPHDTSLDPVNAISVEMWVRPTAPVDCDARNNYRVLLSKGDLGAGSYSLVLEEGERFQARVRTGGTQRSLVGTRAIPVGAWSHVGFTYDASTGAMRFFVNGEQTDSTEHPPMTLSGSTGPLFIGGPGGARATCPDGNGSFQGEIDEVRVSRVVRDLTFAPRPGNDARFVSQWTPPAEAGQPYEAQFTFRNIGTTAWSAMTMHRLGAEAPRDNGRWGTGRVELPRVVQPGEQVTITAALTAPATPGSYPLQFAMVQEGAEWFGEPSELVDVEVYPLGMAPDAGMPPDAGGPDAGMPARDAGPGMDGGPPGSDAGPGFDGGPDFDGGASDAGGSSDASSGGDAGSGGGGGCHLGGTIHWSWWVLLALLGRRRVH